MKTYARESLLISDFNRDVIRFLDFPVWPYKIPDPSKEAIMRGTPKLPYDSFVTAFGHHIAIEWKLHKSRQAFAVNRVPEHQVRGLTGVANCGGTALLMIGLNTEGVIRAMPIPDWTNVIDGLGRKSVPLNQLPGVTITRLFRPARWDVQTWWDKLVLPKIYANARYVTAWIEQNMEGNGIEG